MARVELKWERERLDTTPHVATHMFRNQCFKNKEICGPTLHVWPLKSPTTRLNVTFFLLVAGTTTEIEWSDALHCSYKMKQASP
jgi:hypothetical protein